MKQIIYLKEALECLKANKLRSFLALLGLMIGSASVVALVTIGFLAKHAAIEQFKNLGTQKLLLHFTNKDNDELTSLNNILKNQNIFNPTFITQAHPISSFFKTINYRDIKINSYQIGVTQSIYNSLKIKAHKGRLLTEYDNMQYFAVIGNDLLTDIKKEHNLDILPGDSINIEDNLFTVVGTLEHWPIDPLFNYNINRSILIPLQTAQYISNNYAINELYIDVNKTSTPKQAENYLTNILHHITPKTKIQFTNAEQILEQLEQQAHILTILLGAIGAISLLVGAIGVMNIMLVAIVERKPEIGLRMAIGATPYEIKLQFLCEAVSLTTIGGLFGTILGILIPYIITYLAGWEFTLPYSSIVFGLIVSLGVGITAGFYPALKASRMLPVTCLTC